ENKAMPIGHSARFVVVDRRGQIRGLVDSQVEGCVEKVMALVETLAAEPRPQRLGFPDEIFTSPWMATRAAAQRKAAAAWNVAHDFTFTDARYASGIGFRNRMVDDGGKHYKAVHYDHGNGVAAADVDGDGHLDLYFSNQVGSNRLYRALGDGRFEDITKRAGVGVADAIGVTASFADTDNDGDPDLYVTTVRGGNRLFLNDGSGQFTDVTEEAGLTYSGHSSAGVFFDFDRDGLLDLLLCNVGTYTTDEVAEVLDDSTTAGTDRGTFRYYVGMGDGFSGHLKSERDEPSILYRNLGKNRFQDVTTSMLLDDGGWTGSATPIDVNGDGWLDLYLCNMQGHDGYYENQEGVAFRRRSREVFPMTPWGSMGVKVFDQDADGDLDLYITDMHSDMSQRSGPDIEKAKSDMRWPESILRSEGKSIFGNALFRREADGRYVEVSDSVGAETYWPWGLSVGDVNADGFADVFVTGGMSYPFRYGINSLLLGRGPKGFVDAEFVLGVEPRPGSLVTPWFDLDCGDGADAAHKDCAACDGAAVVWAPKSSRSSILIDLDGDGDLDIVTNEFNTEPLVLRSDLAQRRAIHWVGVRLRGRSASRDGLGAVVRVHAGGRVFVQAHDGQSGYMSQSAQPLYFGLGEATTIEKIEVQWLGGALQVLAKPGGANRVITIEQPE
ncbi:MAG: CRTAC1 family protein, partial [Planctomycetota bacterium]|nr:CRTAC1 family protein [Planctomycetota bacterium]